MDRIRRALRPRFFGVWVLPVIVLTVLFAIDPDHGLSLAVWVASFSRAFLLMACAHLIRKLFFDYPSADMESLFNRACQTPDGAGRALIALAIIMAAVLMLFSGTARAQDVRSAIPPGAVIYAPVLRAERLKFWPDDPHPQMLGALVEHESCVSLASPRCWNPKASLKNAREEGAGFGQITRAYARDGSVRMDALADLRDRHPALREWSWANVYDRPDLQLRAIVLMSRDNFVFFRRLVADDLFALHFADAAYSGGVGGVQRERQACQLARGCDPKQWFGHVELHCLKSSEKIAQYGNRSACDINRGHVVDVCLVRSRKYAGWV